MLSQFTVLFDGCVHTAKLNPISDYFYTKSAFVLEKLFSIQNPIVDTTEYYIYD